MTDSNPFGALNEAEDTYDTIQQGEQKDADFFTIKSLVPDAKIQLPDAEATQTENQMSLLTCSSIYGYFVAATATGFCMGESKRLRETMYQAKNGQTVPFDELIQVNVEQGKVNHVTLSADQLKLHVAVIGGSLLTYNVHDIVQQKQAATPSQIYDVGAEISSVQPNPEACPDIIAVLTKENQCKLIQNNTVIAAIENICSMCWSRKGKQIACGALDGTITTYDTAGNKKQEIPPPAFQDQDDSKRSVNALIWLENKVFFAVYTKKSQDQDELHLPYIIDNNQTTPDETYVLMDEVLPLIEMDSPNEQYYSVVVREMGPEAKIVIIIANSAASDINIVGQDDDGKWATWILENPVALPLSTDDVNDTYPVGLAIDYSASEPLPPYDSAENETPVPAMPVLYAMITDGRVLCYHVFNQNLAKSGGKCPSMIEAKDFETIPLPQKPAPTAFQSESKIPTAVSSKEDSVFGAAAATAAKPTFGFTGFGSTSSFGSAGTSSPISFSSLAKSSSAETKLPQPVSAFGSTSTFGQSSGFGQPAFGQSSGFGQPAFGSVGQSASTGNVPSFGGFANMVKQPKKPASTTSGQSLFAPSKLESDQSASIEPTPQLTASSEEKPVSAFGQQPTSPFGQQPVSAFGKQPASGSSQNLFGATSFTTPSKSKYATDDEPSNAPSKKIQDVEKPSTKDTPPTQADAKPFEEKDIATITTTTTATAVASSPASPEEDQQISPVASQDDGGCSISFEEVQRSLDVDVNSGSDFTKSDSEHGESHKENVNSEDDYFDEEKHTSSEHESEDDEAETQRKAEEEERIAHEKKLQDEKIKQEQLENKKKAAEEKLITEEKRISEEKRKAEQERLELEARAIQAKKLEEEKARREEQERIAEAKRVEAKRIAAAKRKEEESLAEIERLEQERLAEAARKEAERIAAIKPDIKFAHFEKTDEELEMEPYERSKGLHPMAAEFEEIYLKTMEDMEYTTELLSRMDDELYERTPNAFNPIHADIFDDFDYEWKISDVNSLSQIILDLEIEANAAAYTVQCGKERTERLRNDTEKLEDDRDIIGEYLDEDTIGKQLQDTELVNELETQTSYLQTKNQDIEALFGKVDSQLAQTKKKSEEPPLPRKYSKMKRIELENLIRQTRRNINAYDDKIHELATQELNIRRKNHKN